MAKLPANLIVKPHRPGRNRLLAVGLILASLILAYGIFEFGRFRGGYDLVASHNELVQRDREIARLNRKLAQERDQLVLLQTSGDIDSEAYQKIEQRLQVLQGTIQEQAESLAFYKGIISPEDGVAGLKVQKFAVTPGPAAGQFLVRLVLIQAKDHGLRVTGIVDLSVEGKSRGEVANLGLADLLAGDNAAEKLAFSFRYFQELEILVTLPANFEPETVNVEVRPKGRSARTIRHAFEWQVG
ncbi:MAG: hypothetical protein OQK99_07185 [Gammaproteobacteria bacterium]|nr:hypothetical protein [Gammaproteobacteria bacterium]